MPGQSWVCFPAGARFYFFQFQNFLTGSGDHLASNGYFFSPHDLIGRGLRMTRLHLVSSLIKSS